MNNVKYQQSLHKIWLSRSITYPLADAVAFLANETFSKWLILFDASLGDEKDSDRFDEAGLRLRFASSTGSLLFNFALDFSLPSLFAARADCNLLDANFCRDLVETKCGEDLVDETGDDGLDEMEESGDFASCKVDCFLTLGPPPGFLALKTTQKRQIRN